MVTKDFLKIISTWMHLTDIRSVCSPIILKAYFNAQNYPRFTFHTSDYKRLFFSEKIPFLESKQKVRPTIKCYVCITTSEGYCCDVNNVCNNHVCL